jgi:hypothetical protein
MVGLTGSTHRDRKRGRRGEANQQWGHAKFKKEKMGLSKNTKCQLINSRGVLEAVKGQNSRSWSDPSSDLSSLLFMKGNLLLNEKFFFLRSKVDC